MPLTSKTLRPSEEATLPPLSSVLPATTMTFSAKTSSAGSDMMLGGLPPIHATDKKKDPKITVVDDIDAPVSRLNEIATAFDSLDDEVVDTTDLQCRYRRGKCTQPRTLKKNGSLHSYCEHHRLRSIRNQKVFDQKRRQQRECEVENRRHFYSRRRGV
ncbi:hypothetical protein PHYBOEH_000898 [Phytophthora boehmeriae]|uniref:Uncharacterized protein n=1 Tax=Phytophthora boehmeriae TaxID=109152 RepID=A0A8T1WV37_9STRA|nr:hypothetical protein PHYBOEH_000896 [Phytophthora boehmeriae]KAG7397316.1 hypothetical protein PHYBOEH_000898 [Phytophthora boehmeriae]